MCSDAHSITLRYSTYFFSLVWFYFVYCFTCTLLLSEYLKWAICWSAQTPIYVSDRNACNFIIYNTYVHCLVDNLVMYIWLYISCILHDNRRESMIYVCEQVNEGTKSLSRKADASNMQAFLWPWLTVNGRLRKVRVVVSLLTAYKNISKRQ